MGQKERKLRQRRRRLGCLVAVAVALYCCTALPQVAAAATGSIEGTVTEAMGGKSGIKGLCVAAYAPGQSRYAGAAEATGLAGKYKIEDLGDGSYDVEFFKCAEGFRGQTGAEGNAALNFAPRFYDETASGSAERSDAKAVKLEAGKLAVAGIDAEMKLGGEIEGKVENQAGQPLENVCVIAFLPKGGIEEVVATESKAPDGEYKLTGLASGDYVLEYYGCEKQNVVDAYYDAGASDHRTTDTANVTEVEVEAEREPASVAHLAEVRLEAGGVIEGSIAESVGNAIKTPICVEVGLASGGEEESGDFTITDTGHYRIEGLASGSYDLVAGECGLSKPVWATQYFNGASRLSEATPISVVAGVEPPVPAVANVKLVRTSAVKPASTVAPAVNGTPAVGQTLTCSPGTWSGTPAPSYSYQWLREGSTIAGATGATYVVQTADEGHGLSCTVTATNEAGATSETSAVVHVPKVGIAVVEAATFKSDTVRLTLDCTDGGPCKGLVVAGKPSTEVEEPGRKFPPLSGGIPLGKASFSLASGAHETLDLHVVNAKGRRLLGEIGRRGVKIKVDGNDVKQSTVLLKPAKKAKR